MSAFHSTAGTGGDYSDLEEILNIQRQGRRLSDMQMRSIDQFLKRRYSNMTGGADTQQQQQQLFNTQKMMMNEGDMNMNTMQGMSNNMDLSSYLGSSMMNNPYDQQPQQKMNFSTYGNDSSANWNNANLVNKDAVSEHGEAESDTKKKSAHSHNMKDAMKGRDDSLTNINNMASMYDQEMGRQMGRRTSMNMYNTLMQDMDYKYNQFNEQPEKRSVMPKRNSLDLLGDAANLVSKSETMNQSASSSGMNDAYGMAGLPRDPSARKSSMDMLGFGYSDRRASLDFLGNLAQGNSSARRSSLDFLGGGFASTTNRKTSLDFLMSGDPTLGRRNSLTCFSNSANKRTSLDFLMSGDATLGRRNSLTQILASEFANPGRRGSMPHDTLGNQIDPYQENIFDDPGQIARSSYGFPPSAATGSDLLTLQLLQQQNAEEEHALNNVEDYIRLQKLQSNLRRQSLSNMYDEYSMMQNLNNGMNPGKQPPINPLDTEDFRLYQQRQEEKYMNMMGQMNNPEPKLEVEDKKLNSKRKRKEPEPDPEVLDMNDPPPFTLKRIDNFEDLLNKSIQTQKDIQAWDKKMGLKRSHSATMTKSTRTRKNLKKLMEKHREIIREVGEQPFIPENDDDASSSDSSDKENTDENEAVRSENTEGSTYDNVGAVEEKENTEGSSEESTDDSEDQMKVNKVSDENALLKTQEFSEDIRNQI
jgi:hypothetical protein